MEPTTLTAAELTFLTRMQPHFAKGASVEDAARAVIAEDQRIGDTVLADREFRQAVHSSIAHDVWCRVRGGEG